MKIAIEMFSRLEPQVLCSNKTTDLTAHYRGMLDSHKVEDCLLLFKEIQARQRKMTQQKKRLGQVDTQYLKLAEKMICEEFAVALDITPDSIRERLYAATRCKATA